MNAATPRAFVIGHPIAHSRSPLIHGHWLAEQGIPGFYERIDVPPADVSDFVRSFRDRGYVGGNVTLPHKEAVFRAVDEATELAARLGAVNTLSIGADGQIVGHNTDVEGFVAGLDAAAPGWSGEVATALVFGAGGAARAIVAGLAERGVRRIVIANRTSERALPLRDLAPDRVETITMADLADVLPRADLLVNTTSLGMKGEPPLFVDLARLPDRAVVADIVYVPLETPLLRAARARGLRVADGLAMLLHQAVPGFRTWFGGEPRVTPHLHRLVAEDLGAGP